MLKTMVQGGSAEGSVSWNAFYRHSKSVRIWKRIEVRAVEITLDMPKGVWKYGRPNQLKRWRRKRDLQGQIFSCFCRKNLSTPARITPALEENDNSGGRKS
ncbi:hypothetical protein BXO88_10765 [Oribacterium sp. C9]|nr:hypothetical protein BXO88_10765 [Oribacterium sp. C9]